MTLLATVIRVLQFVPFVPKIVRAVQQVVRRPRQTLDEPLGESEAARALRLEDERRAQVEADATRRGGG